MLLHHTDNSNKALQRKIILAAEGQEVGKMVIATLVTLRTEKLYSLFWKVELMASSVTVGEPKLPCRRKLPSRYEDGMGSYEFHDSPVLHYRQLYYEAIDIIVSCLKDQPGYQIYSNLEQLLSKACQGKEYEDKLLFICDHYKEDSQQELLRVQLQTFNVDFKLKFEKLYGTHVSEVPHYITFFDIKKYF